MPTKQQLVNKIAELEQWLTDNHSEHIARPQIECDLRKAKQELEQLDNWPIERDTFDIRENQFYKGK
ncbi:hypothetical protein [Flavobacterium psychrophilum]|uniref:Uncharacterized protein n=1 Tax=Flavobacterium psychrophilum TaxID=96345 RepID=A0A7U2NHJ2_FLAPS|nr:hypothetical protein [Flavobacterium psychrophilum]OAE92164.1 hypothetical protein SU65_10440 [Flavobacterium psychrophilum]QRE05320.1 hypothetical protein H0H26_06960 [Flavobacterium psychrophilum]SNB07212.1 hypothetical protein KU05112810_190008 [Flavobacterium psychrophilum]